MTLLRYAACAAGALALSLIVEGCGASEQNPSPQNPNDRSRWKKEDYEKAQIELQQKLRTASTYFTPPPQDRVEKFCFAQYTARPQGYNGVRALIGAKYPYHPAQICLPADVKNPKTIDFSKVPAGAIVLKLGALSILNVGGDQSKLLDIESVAGRLLVSLQALSASTLEEAQKQCPSYSPLQEKSWDGSRIPIKKTNLKYVQDYPYATEVPPMIDSYSKILDQLIDNTIEFAGKNHQSIPTPEEMNFLLSTKEGRYWGACQKGGLEAELTPVGAQYTHDPQASLFGDYDEVLAPPQCEVGGWAQVYEYEDRPAATIDGTPQGFPASTKYICLRGLETDPHPLIQGVLEVARLVQEKEVTLGHDHLDPRNVYFAYGIAGRRLHDQTLYAVTIKAEKK